jgi:hypothetical protein
MAHLITSPQYLPSPEATALFDSISMPCHRLPDPIVAFSDLYPAHPRCMRLESTKSKRFFSAYFRCNSPLLSESCQMQVSAPSRQPPMSTPVRHLLRAEGQFSSARDIIIITTSTWELRELFFTSAKRQARQEQGKKCEAQKSFILVGARVGQAHSARSNSCNDSLRQEKSCGGA